MKFKKTGIVVALVLVLSVVLFTACTDTTDTTDTTTTNGDVTTAPVEVDQEVLDQLLEAGKLTVVGSGGYRPFNYIDENGDVIGFDVDTGAAIAERLGVELNYVTSDWDGLVEGLRAQRYDGILGSMAITESRLEVVNFTMPYYFSGAQLVVRKDSGITDPAAMAGKTIAVATGTTFEDDAAALGAEVKTYQDDNATMMELIAGRVDGVITDRLVALGAMAEIAGGDDLTLAGEILRLEEMGIAVNKDNEALLLKLNAILEDMHEDGTLRSISEKWHNGADITIK